MSEPKSPFDSPARRHRLLQLFFFSAFALLIWQLLRILSPFYGAILGAAILSMLIYPVHAWMLRRAKGSPSGVAALTTLLAVLTFVLPICLFSWVLIKETAKVYPVVQESFDKAKQLRVDGALTDSLPPRLAALKTSAEEMLAAWNIDPQDILLKNLDELSSRMTRIATQAIKNTVFVVFNLLILAFTMFFFLRDGPFLIHRVVELVPMPVVHKQAILGRLRTTLYAVIRGVLLVALVQGFLAGIGFAVFRVPFPVLLGAATALLAPIPFVGTAAVWVPVTLGLLVNGAQNQALYVLLWSVLVVGLVDNILRPILIGVETKIPIALLFFGMLGGLRIYGFYGLLLGPLVIALVLAFAKIYREEYRWLLSARPEGG